MKFKDTFLTESNNEKEMNHINNVKSHLDVLGDNVSDAGILHRSRELGGNKHAYQHIANRSSQKKLQDHLDKKGWKREESGGEGFGTRQWNGTNKTVTHTSPDGKHSVKSSIPLSSHGQSYSDGSITIMTHHSK